MSDELNDALNSFSINYPARPKYPSPLGLKQPETDPSFSSESAFPNEDVLQSFAGLSMTDAFDAGEGSSRSADRFSGGRTPTYVPGGDDGLSRGFGDLSMTDNFTAEPEETENLLDWTAGDVRACTPPPFSREYPVSHNDDPDPDISAVTRSSTFNTDISEDSVDSAMKLDDSLVKAMAHMHRRKSVSTKMSRTPIGKDGQGKGKGKLSEGEGSARGRERGEAGLSYRRR